MGEEVGAVKIFFLDSKGLLVCRGVWWGEDVSCNFFDSNGVCWCYCVSLCLALVA